MIDKKLNINLSEIVDAVEYYEDQGIEQKVAYKLASSLEKEITQSYENVIFALQKEIDCHREKNLELLEKNLESSVQSIYINHFTPYPRNYANYEFEKIFQIQEKEEYQYIYQTNDQYQFTNIINMIQKQYEVIPRYECIKNELLTEKKEVLSDLFSKVIKLIDSNQLKIDFFEQYYDFIFESISSNDLEKEKMKKKFSHDDIILLSWSFKNGHLQKELLLSHDFNKVDFFKQYHIDAFDKKIVYELGKYTFDLFDTTHNIIFKINKPLWFDSKNLNFDNMEKYFIDVNDYYQKTGVKLYEHVGIETVYQNNQKIFDNFKKFTQYHKQKDILNAKLDHLKIFLDLNNEMIQEQKENTKIKKI